MSQANINPNYPASSSSKVAVTFPGDYTLADEGSYFTAVQASTASTAVGNSTQALGATNPGFAIFNGSTASPAGNGYNIYLRYIKITVTAAASGYTSLNYVGSVDTQASKLTTITTALSGYNNNTGSGTKPAGLTYGGVLIAAAVSSAGRIQQAGEVVGALPVVFDEWVFDFASPTYGKNIACGTTTLVSARTIPMGPVILAPQWWYTLGFWGASAAGTHSFAIEVGWIERPQGQ